MTETNTSDSRMDSEVGKEAVTMALYVSLSLLAVLVATATITQDTKGEVARTVFLTACGLLVAHLVAFAVSSRLVSKGNLDEKDRRILVAQVVAGLAVALIATIPTLVLNPDISSQASEFILIAFICLVGYRAARQSGGTKARALVYSAVVLAAAMVVLMVKGLVGH